MANNGTEGKPASIDLDQLVVAQSHRGVLAEFCPGPLKQVQQNDTLGLALYDVDPVRALAQIKDVEPPDDVREQSPMGRLVWALRQRCARRYGGWTFTVGRNRRVQAIFAAPHIGTGAPFAAVGYPHILVDKPFELAKASEGGKGHGVRVGILDTRVYPNEQLAGRYMADAESELPAEAKGPISHYEGHATFIAGLVLAQAPNAELEIHDVLHGDEARATAWELATSMARLAGSGIDVLNLSLACQTQDGQPPMVLSRAVDLLSPEMVIVAAAGNIDNDLVDGTKPMWPAAFDKVISVGACDDNGVAADFSPAAPWVDLLAHGVDVSSTYLVGKVTIKCDGHDDGHGSPVDFDGCARWSGTSFAAATVSGVIAAELASGNSPRPALRVLREHLAHKAVGGIRVP
jgi:subtilisin family serine protease